ncbi:hypothetical protein ILUMI_22754 [Ignelater luminosus]|uniref:DUF4817 domain-containing protein n=1 Tax=Ignelater luminosus TaxID=2038154 RepID=A0A8K0CGI2_IGNLU|nr:hypothetical protein ILUMI_22754 [Ignelater luminosus]
MVDSPLLLKMDRYLLQRRILIVEHYFKNGETLTATIGKLRPIFDNQNVPSASTMKSIIKKFEETGLITDVKPSMRVRLGRSGENITAVRQNVAECPGTSIRHPAQELNILRSTILRVLTISK